MARFEAILSRWLPDPQLSSLWPGLTTTFEYGGSGGRDVVAGLEVRRRSLHGLQKFRVTLVEFSPSHLVGEASAHR